MRHSGGGTGILTRAGEGHKDDLVANPFIIHDNLQQPPLILLAALDPSHRDTEAQRHGPLGRPMRTIYIQFHPRRAPPLSIRAISRLMIEIATSNYVVRDFSMQRRGMYVNYFFTATNQNALWRRVRVETIENRLMGTRLRASTIVVAQGSRGWENYRLLHHFDTRQDVDSLQTRRSRRKRSTAPCLCVSVACHQRSHENE